MGDERRFHLFAAMIANRFPNKQLRIGDVAGGKGHLQLALVELGYQNVVTIDKRYRHTKKPIKGGRQLQYKYGHLDNNTPIDFDLLVGLHPDGATDVIIHQAAKRQIPFVICPCCIIPTAYPFNEQYKSSLWANHLERIALREGFKLEKFWLKMNGQNLVMIGKR